MASEPTEVLSSKLDHAAGWEDFKLSLRDPAFSITNSYPYNKQSTHPLLQTMPQHCTTPWCGAVFGHSLKEWVHTQTNPSPKLVLFRFLAAVSGCHKAKLVDVVLKCQLELEHMDWIPENKVSSVLESILEARKKESCRLRLGPVVFCLCMLTSVYFSIYVH